MFYLYNETEAVGPFSAEQLEAKLQNGEVQSGDLVRFKGAHGLTWKSVSEVLKDAGKSAVAPVLTGFPPRPDVHCYINVSGNRQGPYTAKQISKMWESGLITADATVEWERCMRPLAISTFIDKANQKQSARRAHSSPPRKNNWLGIAFMTGLFVFAIIAILAPEHGGVGTIKAGGGILYNTSAMPAEIGEQVANIPGVMHMAKSLAGSPFSADAIAPAVRGYVRMVEQKYESAGRLVHVAPSTSFEAIRKTTDSVGLEIYKVRLTSGEHNRREGYMYPEVLQFSR